MEEVEDEGDSLSALRVEVYMRPEEVWPQMRTNSAGDSTSPVREVLNRITTEGRTPADRGASEARKQGGSEAAGEEEKSPKCKRVISVGASAAPARGVDPSSHGNSTLINPKTEVMPIDPNQPSAWEGNDSRTEEIGIARADGTAALERVISVGVGATPPQGSTH